MSAALLVLGAVWATAKCLAAVGLLGSLALIVRAMAWEVSDRNVRRREAEADRRWLDAVGSYDPTSGQSFSSYVQDGPLERWASVDAMAGIRAQPERGL